MAYNKNIDLHQQWIGYLNPIGLVFSPQALEDAQVVINNTVIAEQKEFARHVCIEKDDTLSFKGLDACRSLFTDVLKWRDTDLDESVDSITSFSFSHPQFEEVISPTHVVKINENQSILIKSFDNEIDFDKINESEDSWNSSIHFKFERLLREKQVSTGIILSKIKLRLIYAPRGESSGYIDFPFHIMYQPSGRLIFSAFNELFSETKVFNSPKNQSLIEVLELSRKYQAKVSIALSGQVLAALYELLRGFQSANDEDGSLLKETLEKNPQEIYEGLLTVLLRMVFIMYSEDRNLLATDEVYQSSYSLAGLFERLRQDEAQNPDTMDSRYGAWAQLLSLFRLVYDGAEYDSEKGKVILPARHGHLFDPDKYLFLESRKTESETYSRAPKISDGVIFNVLSNLLLLDGERISYRTLDVEQIGSVYETMMGFELDIASGETIALKPAKAHGAPIPINLDEILNVKDKSKKLTELSGLKVTDKLKKELDSAKTIAEIENVLDKRIDRRATPFRLSKGAMVLSPSEARRKSGSHYTPRELTEPIVRTALKPIFERLGNNPKPEEILDLKICDPAMGSGAFLVEACRQLAEKLLESWNFYKTNVQLPSDEDELLYAKRIIAQKCLYGVDKNHMAVNLAKLSLWLVTLAKDHAFSFLDHNLKYGDSLVGLTNKQIMAFDYKDRTELPLFAYMKDKINEAVYAREEIRNANQEKQYDALQMVEESYSDNIGVLRLVGNLAVNCFFEGKNEKERNVNIQKHQVTISNFFAASADDKLQEYCKKNLEKMDKRIVPFHWELEFPEVFSRENSGFDCYVGNPPFFKGGSISFTMGPSYLDYLLETYKNSHGNSDMVAYFFRKAFLNLNSSGTMSLISTNTISQGDTRTTGLAFICKTNGKIYDVTKRYKWPGQASVVVSIVSIIKDIDYTICNLNNVSSHSINSFLIEADTEFEPKRLKCNESVSFTGMKVYGQGFLFDDSDDSGESNSIKLMAELCDKNVKNKKAIFPYIGGEEVNAQPTHLHHRFAIDFNDLSEEAVISKWPELFAIVKDKVKPFRDTQRRDSLRLKWWQYGEKRPALRSAISRLDRILVNSQVSAHLIFTFIPTGMIYAHTLGIFANSSYAFFSSLQSGIHETWARFFSSSLEDRLRYTPSDCFETFPLSKDFEFNQQLEQIGKEYFDYRAKLMKESNEGATKIYNRFHDSNETNQNILKLRELHQEMDQAVLEAYGWHDLTLKYDFILDYEDDVDTEEINSRKKKPYRYKFTPELHDEILARLLKLNHDRYEEEVRFGLHRK